MENRTCYQEMTYRINVFLCHLNPALVCAFPFPLSGFPQTLGYGIWWDVHENKTQSPFSHSFTQSLNEWIEFTQNIEYVMIYPCDARRSRELRGRGGTVTSSTPHLTSTLGVSLLCTHASGSYWDDYSVPTAHMRLFHLKKTTLMWWALVVTCTWWITEHDIWS